MRVALVTRNDADAVAALYAIWRAGLVGVPVNADSTPREVAHVLCDSGAATVVADPASVVLVEAARERGAAPGTVLVTGPRGVLACAGGGGGGTGRRRWRRPGTASRCSSTPRDHRGPRGRCSPTRRRWPTRSRWRRRACGWRSGTRHPRGGRAAPRLDPHGAPPMYAAWAELEGADVLDLGSARYAVSGAPVRPCRPMWSRHPGRPRPPRSARPLPRGARSVQVPGGGRGRGRAAARRDRQAAPPGPPQPLARPALAPRPAGERGRVATTPRAPHAWSRRGWMTRTPRTVRMR